MKLPGLVSDYSTSSGREGELVSAQDCGLPLLEHLLCAQPLFVSRLLKIMSSTKFHRHFILVMFFLVPSNIYNEVT